MEGSFDPDCRRCMPWEEIEAGTFDDKITNLKTLITIRKTYAQSRSGQITWITDRDNKRLIHYVKTASDEKQLHVILNASGQSERFTIDGELLFSYDCKDNNEDQTKTILPDGCMIYLTK